MKVCIWLACLATFYLAAGCETQPEGEDPQLVDSLQTVDEQGDGEQEVPDYQAFLTGSLTDTLSGDAHFGLIYHVATQRSELLIELEAGSDFTGGLFITTGDSALPRPGQYDLAVPAEGDTTTRASPFSVIYRRGLILDLTSVRGTLDLTTVTDTLIQGSFDTVMQGDVPIPNAGVQRGEVRARGEFKAVDGSVGYVVGVSRAQR